MEGTTCPWYVDLETPDGKHIGNERCETYAATGSYKEHVDHHATVRILDLAEFTTAAAAALAFICRSTAQRLVVAIERNEDVSRSTLATVADLLAASAAYIEAHQ